MVSDVEIKLTPLARGVGDLAVGAAISFLVLTAVGTIVGLVSWPIMQALYSRANQALGFAGFLVNALSLAISLFLLLTATNLAAELPPALSGVGRIGRILKHNEYYLKVSVVVSLVALIDLVFSFLRQQGSNLLVVQVGNATQIDFQQGLWIILFGSVLPLLIVLLLLALVAKRSGENAGN